MIDAMSLSSLAKVLPGTLSGSACVFDHLVTDSRTAEKGAVYLALKGETFDGHQFIAAAVNNGCVGVIGEQAPEDVKLLASGKASYSYLQVNDTKQALASIALLNRKKFKGKLIALTGSAGKTSTKNMLSSILAEHGATAATQGNFNNEIGVPLTLLDIKAEHQFSVVEMGARKQGDIAYLSHIALPDVALVLNAGSAHIEIFGDYETIVATKGEIYDSLNAKGIGVLNFDDPAYLTWLERLGGRQKLSFSMESENADVFATDIDCKADGSFFSLNYCGERVAVSVPVPGLHQIQNALAAAASAIAVACPLEAIAKGLAKVASSEGRMNFTDFAGIKMLDDSYNANPVSMKAALDVLAMQPGYRIAVLGEMAELGPYANEAHIDLANYAAETGIEQVCLIGPYAGVMSEVIGEHARVFTSKDILVAHVVDDSHEDKIVMIKGSRSAAMDEVVNLIKSRVH